jgi:transcriptional regulator with XRE-family HTH domain
VAKYRRITRNRLASAIAQAIAARRLTLAQAGELGGCSERTLIRTLAGDVVPHASTVRRFAEACELDVELVLEARAASLRTRRRRSWIANETRRSASTSTSAGAAEATLDSRLELSDGHARIVARPRDVRQQAHAPVVRQ